MRILLTRPREDCKFLASRLQALGCKPILEPMLFIDIIKNMHLDLDNVQALLATSANGIRAFATLSPCRDLKILTVGDASAKVAHVSGFTDVKSAGGNVHSLAHLVKHLLNPQAGTVLHLAGTQVTGNLAKLLQVQGFTYRRAVLYTARKAKAFSAKTIHALRSDHIDGVSFFSPRTAQNFAHLTNTSKLIKKLRRVTAYCLSANVAEKVQEIPWCSLRIAEHPKIDSLLDLIIKDL